MDWYVAYGYHPLKIHNSFHSAILRETVAYAHSRSMRVSGHVPAFMRAQEVVEQVYDEIQHITQVMLNFLVKPDTDTQTLERFYLADLVLVDGDPTRQIAEALGTATVDIPITCHCEHSVKANNQANCYGFARCGRHFQSQQPAVTCIPLKVHSGV